MAAPTVTSVSPSTGTGGDAVAIVGTGFTTATSVTFGGSSASFTAVSAALIVAAAPVRSAGAVTVAVTNPDGTSSDAVTFTYSSSPVLFSAADARTFDKRQLQDGNLYTDTAIVAKELTIRAKFERIIGVALAPTAHTEYYDGDGSAALYLLHHNPYASSTPSPVTLTSVTVIATDDTETAFTADELSDVVKYPHKLVRRSGTFTSGSRNLKVVYSTGYTAAPADIKAAALLACVQEMVPSLVPSSVIDGSDGTINWSRVKDPERGRWYGNEAIDAVLREHRMLETMPGIV